MARPLNISTTASRGLAVDIASGKPVQSIPRRTGSTGNMNQGNGQTMTMPSTTNWYKGNQPTLREAYAQIINVSQTDRARGKQAYDMLNTLQQDPTSVYYNPYNSYTNRAVDSLRELGVNVDSINEDWYASNEWLKEYTRAI